MDDILTRVWQNLISRPSGPLSMRFILQPTMAVLLAIRAGIRDARAGSPAYLWTAFTNREARGDLIRNGWKDIAKVFIIAICLDLVFQMISFGWIYPLEALFIASI